jgi:hypothetical protein
MMNLKENGSRFGMEAGGEEAVWVSPGTLGTMTPKTEIRAVPDCSGSSRLAAALAAVVVEGETAMVVVDALAEGPWMSRH